MRWSVAELSETVERRFWPKVRKTPGCWLWVGSKTMGYGQLGTGGDVSTKILAHRLSWLLHHGSIPEGVCVLHKCDVRACVRPDHLFLGTHRDNMLDAEVKGRARHPCGEEHSHAKLTEEGVRKARWLRQQGASIYRLAHQFGVSDVAMRNALIGRTWRCV